MKITKALAEILYLDKNANHSNHVTISIVLHIIEFYHNLPFKSRQKAIVRIENKELQKKNAKKLRQTP